jgi:hypothetical protein
MQTRNTNIQTQLVNTTKALDECKRVSNSTKESLETRIKQLGLDDSDRFKRLDATLSSKNAELKDLETQLAEITNTVVVMKKDREKTIDAHQSRIRQLQDKFTRDLAAGKQEVVIVCGDEEKLRVEAIVAGVRKEGLEQVADIEKKFAGVEKRMESTIKRLEREIVAKQEEIDKSTRDLEGLDVSCQKAIDSLSSKLQSLETENKRIKSEKIMDDGKKEREDGKEMIKVKEAEIAFLKNTVRIECEERMGLLAVVERLRKGGESVTPVIASAAGSGRNTPKNKKK